MSRRNEKMGAWPADEVSRRPVADLVPYDRNARTHSDEQIDQIAASIEAWGWTIPVLIDEAGGVIAGHGRLLAAAKLGIEQVPTMVARGWSKEQRRAYVIADNKLASNAGWDDELLRLELTDLLGSNFDLSLAGFHDQELAEIFAGAQVGLTDPDDAPPLPETPTARLGDVWMLGRHRLVCGDSTDAGAVAECLDGAKPNLMVTDPPYGVNYDPAWRDRAGFGSAGSAKGKVLNDDRADWREAWQLFPGAVAYVWHGGLHGALVTESLAACGLNIRAQIIWVKHRPAFSRGHYHWQHEPAFYAVHEGADDDWRFNEDHEVLEYSVLESETADWQGGRRQSTVWFIEHIKSDTGHAAQKPVECMRRPIENNSSVGDSIYEPFSGSGTTIIAAEITGRTCLAIELSPAYVDVAVQRWEEFTGEKSKRNKRQRRKATK